LTAVAADAEQVLTHDASADAQLPGHLLLRAAFEEVQAHAFALPLAAERLRFFGMVTTQPQERQG
jgi:hypothetical protein